MQANVRLRESPGAGGISRRRALCASMAASAMLVSARGGAGSVAAPIGLQAELLAKVAEYDKNFTARGGEKAHVLLVTRPTNADSVTVAQQMASALGRIPQIAGLPHDEAIVPYVGAAELARACRERRV